MFSRQRVYIDFRRLALNMNQVEEQNPPPNPAKITDSRFRSYQEQFGDESWELDALTPQYLNELVRDEVESLIDWEEWEEALDRINLVKDKLTKLARDFDKE